jgi:hypothetical protein
MLRLENVTEFLDEILINEGLLYILKGAKSHRGYRTVYFGRTEDDDFQSRILRCDRLQKGKRLFIG